MVRINLKMKEYKITIIGFLASILSSVILASCDKPKKTVGTTISAYGKLTTVKHTDSCEYILWDNGYGHGSCMLHSGNCHNPAHKNNTKKLK